MKKNIEIDNLPSDIRAQYKRFKVMHAEKKIQRKAKDDFMSFTKAVWPEFIEGAHHRVISEKFNDNPIKFLAKGLGDIFIDEVLDVFLTPDGLERLINGENPSSIIKNKEKSNKNDDLIISDEVIPPNVTQYVKI